MTDIGRNHGDACKATGVIGKSAAAGIVRANRKADVAHILPPEILMAYPCQLRERLARRAMARKRDAYPSCYRKEAASGRPRIDRSSAHDRGKAPLA
jgi:hypothetical protein